MGAQAGMRARCSHAAWHWEVSGAEERAGRIPLAPHLRLVSRGALNLTKSMSGMKGCSALGTLQT